MHFPKPIKKHLAQTTKQKAAGEMGHWCPRRRKRNAEWGTREKISKEASGRPPNSYLEKRHGRGDRGRDFGSGQKGRVSSNEKKGLKWKGETFVAMEGEGKGK